MKPFHNIPVFSSDKLTLDKNAITGGHGLFLQAFLFLQFQDYIAALYCCQQQA